MVYNGCNYLSMLKLDLTHVSQILYDFEKMQKNFAAIRC